MAAEKKIGLMGGTFNPIHNGHLNIARQALQEYALDEVWFVPTGQPPHKEVDAHTSRFLREAMVKAAIEGKPHMKLQTLEVRSSDKSYSWLTLNRLKQMYPDCHFYFIIGEDSLDQFMTWVHPERIVEVTDILVAVRQEEPANASASPDLAETARHEDEIQHKIESVSDQIGGHFYMLHSGNLDISSTQLRKMVAAGEDISAYVPARVAEYIRDHRIYLPETEADIDAIEKSLKSLLKPHRYEHTQGVMYTSASLAMRYGYPVSNARIAGLLHDCAKYMSGEELLKCARKNNIPVTEAEESAPQLLHAKVGAFFAETKYDITNEDILHAITVHTTGAEHMNLLDKILFTADYIEPNRDKAPHLSELRNIAFNDLDLAVALILEDTIDYLKDSGQKMDETTVRCWQYYQDLIARRNEEKTSENLA